MLSLFVITSLLLLSNDMSSVSSTDSPISTSFSLLHFVSAATIESESNQATTTKTSMLVQSSRQLLSSHIQEHSSSTQHYGGNTFEERQQMILDKKKHRGIFFRKKPVPLTKMLFPGVTPEVYNENEPVYIITELVTSTKTNVPFEFYDLPGSCSYSQSGNIMKYFKRKRKRHLRHNLGIRLQGLDLKPSPHTLRMNMNLFCTPTCTSADMMITNLNQLGSTTTTAAGSDKKSSSRHHMTSTGSNSMIQPQYIENHQIRHLRKLIDHHYRVNIMLDQLPVLMKSPSSSSSVPNHHPYAIRGYPVGFKAPPSYTGLDYDEYYLYNHLRFTITIRHINSDNVNEDKLYHITGFEVHPVSITHDLETGSTCYGLRSQMNGGNVEEEEEGEGDDTGEEEEETASDDGEDEGADGATDDGGTDEEEEKEDGAPDVAEIGGDDNGNDKDKGQGEDDQPQRRRRLTSKSQRKTKKKSMREKYQVVNDPNTYLALRLNKGQTALPILYTYEVEWVVNPNLDWSDRWDIYLMGSPDDDIHFFAILNSFMIVLFLTGAIAIIMIRTLKKDILAYNNNLDGSGSSNDIEETGWKLVHGDVFRPPTYRPMLLAVLVGTGAQIGIAIFSTMVIAVLKIINPIRKGQTLTAIVVLYVFSGCVSGYVSARIHKFYDLKSWKMNTLLTATILPGFLIGAFTFLNIILSFKGAATAVSIWLILGMFALWVCVSSPLVFIGAYFGYRRDKMSVPVKTNHIARLIPQPQPWYSTPPVSFLVGGILPFGSVCIELFFILSALWLHQIYYVMGFLLVVLLILAATCAQVSIVMDYLQLCAEDHKWWWKSFGNCASAGLYLFLYSLWFSMTRLKLVGVLPVFIYVTYMFLISLCFGLCCGSIGFGCAFWFNRQIYGALKVD